MVRLKARFRRSNIGYLRHFNSTMVRLKVIAERIVAQTTSNFNSTMVRLKEDKNYGDISKISWRFQFHYGTIKSHYAWVKYLKKGISIPLWYD